MSLFSPHVWSSLLLWHSHLFWHCRLSWHSRLSGYSKSSLTGYPLQHFYWTPLLFVSLSTFLSEQIILLALVFVIIMISSLGIQIGCNCLLNAFEVRFDVGCSTHLLRLWLVGMTSGLFSRIYNHLSIVISVSAFIIIATRRPLLVVSCSSFHPIFSKLIRC